MAEAINPGSLDETRVEIRYLGHRKTMALAIEAMTVLMLGTIDCSDTKCTGYVSCHSISLYSPRCRCTFAGVKIEAEKLHWCQKIRVERLREGLLECAKKVRKDVFTDTFIHLLLKGCHVHAIPLLLKCAYMAENPYDTIIKDPKLLDAPGYLQELNDRINSIDGDLNDFGDF